MLFILNSHFSNLYPLNGKHIKDTVSKKKLKNSKRGKNKITFSFHDYLDQRVHFFMQILNFFVKIFKKYESYLIISDKSFLSSKRWAPICAKCVEYFNIFFKDPKKKINKKFINIFFIKF